MKNKVAVLIPCYNEEAAIAQVVDDFKSILPEADIYVYDNNSTDLTAEKAKTAGAVVRCEEYQGKGNVVRRMFADVEADIYVMSDGDKTYDISRVPELIAELQNHNLDMVIGARKEVDLAAYRVGHRLGNFILTKLVQYFFSRRLMDMLSGLRVFSRRFVKTFPALSAGFEIETELTIFALSSRMPIKEIMTEYYARPSGSESKLSTYKDGMRILLTIVNLVKEERPLFFFSAAAIVFLASSIVCGIPVVSEYIESGEISRLPLAVLASALAICGMVSFPAGFVLDSIAKSRKETRRQNYLNFAVNCEKKNACGINKSVPSKRRCK